MTEQQILNLYSIYSQEGERIQEATSSRFLKSESCLTAFFTSFLRS